MPSHPQASGHGTSIVEFGAQLEHLSNILPHVAKSFLAALLTQKKGDVNAVVNNVLTQQEMEADGELNDGDMTVGEACHATSAGDFTTIAAKTAISSTSLTQILANVQDSERLVQPSVRSGKILSFHRPEKNTVSAFTDEKKEYMPKGVLQLCSSCTKYIASADYFFCPYCGALAKKNYRRL
jgi:hypothetical protein